MIGDHILLGFSGKELPPEARAAIHRWRPAGFTLMHERNLETPEQVRRLTAALQQAAREEDLPPFLIAIDQEGGQLLAVGVGTTPLPGNLALGAAGSTDLARQAGQVLGIELAAMGVNIDFAPCCDVNSNPLNPVIGTRSFGEDPQVVAEMAAAMIGGIQSVGVAATAKHFPGHGDTTSDSHHGVPVIPHSLERLQQVEFLPFRSAVQAGVRLIMTAHLALPAIDRRVDLPATLSPRIMKGLLRSELGFDGLIVTDAMDMKAIRQGDALGGQAVQALNAGVDLLLLTQDPEDHRRVFTSLETAFQQGSAAQMGLQPEAGGLSNRRLDLLHRWLAGAPPQPELNRVGCPEHLALADEIAARSITLVRNQAGLLPMNPSSYPNLAVILFEPLDLTPADTSSFVRIRLAEALRQYYPAVDEYLLPHAPGDAEIAQLVDRLAPAPGNPSYQAVIVGTINAYAQPGQAALVRALCRTGLPVIVAALRMPYDLMAFPEAPVFLCTYSILEPSMRALSRVLCGQARPPGRLPVSIPGFYPVGAYDPSF